MSNFPVGRKLRFIGETNRSVPTPVMLSLAMAINSFVLLLACFLLLFLHPQNLTTPFTGLQEAGIALFGVLGSGAVIWSLSTGRRVSRMLILLNTVGVSALCLSFYFGVKLRDHSTEFLLGLALVSIPTSAALFLNRTVRLYYQVLAGKADASDLDGVIGRQADRINTASQYAMQAGELFVVILALLVFIYPYFMQYLL